jgi:hypothetical protein
MGDVIIDLYKKHVTKEHKIAFLVTWLGGILIHAYKFLNYLPNYDSLLNIYSKQDMLESGRWALSLACGISSYFDLPWVIGLLSCTYIALTAVIVVSVLRIKKPMIIALVGLFLASAPATTQIYVFLFTADGYMLGLLLAALGVYLSRIEEKRISRHIVSALCICIACGIYQSHVSFALILALVYFMDVLLYDRFSKKDCLKWVLRQAILYSVALAAYFVIWKGTMWVLGVSPNEYQGLSQLGEGVNVISNFIVKPIKSVLIYFMQNDVIEHGFTVYATLNILNLVLLGIAILMACIKSKIYKRTWALILFALCLIAMIPFSCYCHWVSNSVIYQARMLQCLILVFVLSMILVEGWMGKRIKNLACVLLLVTVINNVLMANVSYFYMEKSYERTYAEGIEIMDRVYDLQEHHEIERIAVIGTRKDIALDFADPETKKLNVPGQVQIITNVVTETMIMWTGQTESFLDYAFDLTLEPLPYQEKKDLLETSNEVQNMPCWPAQDSVKVLDGILVIKFSNEIGEEQEIPMGDKYH